MATLRRGDQGEHVALLQRALNAAGPHPPLLPLIVDGNYGLLTESTVRLYQQRRGLSVDGVAGPQTLRALGVVVPADAGAPPEARPSDVRATAGWSAGTLLAFLLVGGVLLGVGSPKRAKPTRSARLTQVDVPRGRQVRLRQRSPGFWDVEAVSR